MKCDRFRAWLEDRDLYDVSEADRAHRHATECQNCNEMLRKDAILDRFIGRALAARQVPEGLSDRIEMSLVGQVPDKPGRSALAMVVALCLLIIVTVVLFDGRLRFETISDLAGYALLDHQKHNYGEVFFEPVADAGLWLAANGRGGAVPSALVKKEYTVKGARFCRLGNCHAVHLLYEKEGRPVSVFVLDEGEVGFPLDQGRIYSLNIEGRSVRILRQQNMVYAVVT